MTADEDSRHLSSVVIRTLFSGKSDSVSDFDDRLAVVAGEWQEVGSNSALSEMLSVMHGVQPNRATELVGRIAAAGEQLGLAGASNRDARAWLLPDVDRVHASLAGRALAEVAGYFAIAAAHGLVNVTARLYAFEERTQNAFRTMKNSRTEDFPPFGTRSGHWLSFNSNSIDLVRSATIHHPSASALLEVLEQLNGDDRWVSLMGRRHNDFHRWRPQSILGGVDPATPWRDAGDGAESLVVYEGNAFVPLPIEDVVAEVHAGLGALVEAMESWISRYPDALGQVHTFTLAARRGEML